MFLKEQNKIWIAESIITPYGEVRKDGWDPKQRADALLCSAFTSCNKESVRGEKKICAEEQDNLSADRQKSC